MSKTRYQNEKMKRKYFDWVKGALGLSVKTIKVKEMSLWKYDEFTKYQDYKKFNAATAKQFIKWIKTKNNPKTNESVALSTQYHILRHLSDFFTWLSIQPGYKSKIKHDDIAYLRLNKAESKIATSPKKPKYPTLSYIKKLCSFEVRNEIDMRDRALIAFTALSGMRDLAIATLPLGVVDIEKFLVEQDPADGVQTKNSKLTYTTLFSFDEQLEQYVVDWYKYLRDEKFFDNKMPLFPATKIEHKSKNEHTFVATGVSKEFWADAGPIRKIFKARMQAQGLEYYSPHKFRHFVVAQSFKYAVGAEEMKAISQNLGHTKLSTTFYSYGAVDEYRVADIISSMDFTDKQN